MTARFSEALGMTARGTADRIEACLAHYRLPVSAEAEDASIAACMRTMARFEGAVPERVGWSLLKQLDTAFLSGAWQRSQSIKP